MMYTQLPETYKYDTLAEAIYAREVEYFHYDFDRMNFEHILANASDGAFTQQVSERLAATLQQIDNVQSVLEALWAQVDDKDAYEDAVKRTSAKRASKED